jgi:hypothetical protein
MEMESLHINTQENQEKVEDRQETQEKHSILDKFRSKLLVAVCLGSEAFLAACGGLRKEDIESMPTTKIEDIMKNPEAFTKRALIKVEGYPVSTGRQSYQFMTPVYKTINGVPDKNGMSIPIVIFDHFDYTTQDTDSYDIHTTSDTKSQSLKAVSRGGQVTMSHILVHAGPEQIEFHKSEIVGKLESVGENDKKTYVLEIQGFVDEETQTTSDVHK